MIRNYFGDKINMKLLCLIEPACLCDLYSATAEGIWLDGYEWFLGSPQLSRRATVECGWNASAEKHHGVDEDPTNHKDEEGASEVKTAAIRWYEVDTKKHFKYSWCSLGSYNLAIFRLLISVYLHL